MTRGLTVELGQRSYPIEFPQDLEAAILGRLDELKQRGRSSVLITDRGVALAQADLLLRCFDSVPQLVVEAGEKAKSLDVLGRVWGFLAEQRVNRQSVLWVLGGGVTGDLGGFAAASYLRGIQFVQVPTTLLAMVDSSVGGKTGLNLATGKNLVGAFHHPLAVLVGPALLETLPPREFAAGMAEVIKYGLLGDAALFAQLERAALHPRHPDLPGVIRRCCEVKAGIVRDDELELAAEDGRALLNLGHTFGHAIEQVTGYGTYLHGEAVAIGLVAAGYLSQRLGLLGAADVARIGRVLAANQLPVRLRTPLALGDLQEAATRDKKNRAEGARFVVLNAVGSAATRSGIPAADVEAAWRHVGAT